MRVPLIKVREGEEEEEEEGVCKPYDNEW